MGRAQTGARQKHQETRNGISTLSFQSGQQLTNWFNLPTSKLNLECYFFKAHVLSGAGSAASVGPGSTLLRSSGHTQTGCSYSDSSYVTIEQSVALEAAFSLSTSNYLHPCSMCMQPSCTGLLLLNLLALKV